MVLPLSEAEVSELKQNQKLKDFIGRNGDKDAWSPRTAYQYLHACGFCGLSPDTAWLGRFLGKLFKGMRSLGDRYYLARIRREFLLVSCADWISILDGGRVDEWRSAEELWMCLYLHEGSAAPLRATKEDLILWLQACKTPDGGFGGVQGTTSFIENTHWCLSALSLSGGVPMFSDRARDFILRCKKRGGGFARKSGGTSFLYATWHAVAGLTLLHHMKETERSETKLNPER